MSKIIENYKLQEVIGSGQFGKVYKGVQLINQKLFAIKQVKNSIFEANPKLKEFTVNEIKTLSQIDSPHVVKFKEMLKTTNNVYFVYEYCNGGTLDAQITLNGYYPEEKALGVFKQLLAGFKEVNKLNIIHRDLKPQNILFHNQIVKIGDFGFCKQLERKEEMVKTMLGSPIYMAPEVLNGQDYCIKADIWSLGVVLYEMLYGVCPFTAKSIASLIIQIEKNDLIIPTQINVSNSTKQLLTRMLTKNHKHRISWEELFALPQFQEQSPKKVKNCQFNRLNDNSYIPSLANMNSSARNLQFSSSQKSNNLNSLTNNTANQAIIEDMNINHSPESQQINLNQQNLNNHSAQIVTLDLQKNLKQENQCQRSSQQEQITNSVEVKEFVPELNTRINSQIGVNSVEQIFIKQLYPFPYKHFKTKSEFLNLILKYRNKLLYLTTCLLRMNQFSIQDPATQSLSLIVYLYSQLVKNELLDAINIQLKLKEKFTFESSKELFFFSFEFKKVQETMLNEIKQLSTIFESELTQLDYQNQNLQDKLHNLIEYVKRIINQDDIQASNSKEQLILCNWIIDALLLDELFLNFIEDGLSIEEQEYFKQVEKFQEPELLQIICKKMSFFFKKIDKIKQEQIESN